MGSSIDAITVLVLSEIIKRRSVKSTRTPFKASLEDVHADKHDAGQHKATIGTKFVSIFAIMFITSRSSTTTTLRTANTINAEIPDRWLQYAFRHSVKMREKLKDAIVSTRISGAQPRKKFNTRSTPLIVKRNKPSPPL